MRKLQSPILLSKNISQLSCPVKWKKTFLQTNGAYRKTVRSVMQLKAVSVTLIQEQQFLIVFVVQPFKIAHDLADLTAYRKSAR